MRTAKSAYKVFLVILGIAVLFFLRTYIIGAAVRVRGTVQNIFSPYDVKMVDALRTENASLRNELQKAEKSAGSERGTFVEAYLYSRYPFNDKMRIVIDKGSADGIEAGMPVFIEKNVLIGKVRSVRNFQSEVITIFDPEWKSSILVGESKTKAVLQGANEPRAELIPKDAKVEPGDEVTNIDEDFPLGVSLGTVQSVGEDTKKVWKVAPLILTYTFDEAEKVYVMTNFK